MVNQQKQVQQETAYNISYSAVVENEYHMYPRPCLHNLFYPFWVKNDIGTGIHIYRDGDTTTALQTVSCSTHCWPSLAISLHFMKLFLLLVPQIVS